MKPLTQREVSCLQWAAIGKTSWEMGLILGLTERTINFHIHNACRKLGVHGRKQAIPAPCNPALFPALAGQFPPTPKLVGPAPREPSSHHRYRSLPPGLNLHPNPGPPTQHAIRRFHPPRNKKQKNTRV